MPGLSKPPSRTLLHTRAIELSAFERADGLIDVEAHLVDRKPFDLVLSHGRTKVAGQPIHDMYLRLTITAEREIVATEAVMDVPAHDDCRGALPNYGALEGIRIGPGWIKEAHRRMARTAGCTHISEMLLEMGTVAMQALFGRANRDRATAGGPPRLDNNNHVLDSCYGWRTGGTMQQLMRAAPHPNPPHKGEGI